MKFEDKTRYNHYLNQDTKVIRWKKPQPYDYNELWIEDIKKEHRKDNWYLISPRIDQWRVKSISDLPRKILF